MNQLITTLLILAKKALCCVMQLSTKITNGLVRLLEKYDMEMNKISGAVFLAGIVALVSGILASGIYPGGEHGGHDSDAKRGYVVEGAEAFAEGASGAGEVKADTGPVDIAAFLATANIEKGQKLLKKCTACHTFDKGGKNGVGPNNYGIVGKPIASVAGFTYSDALGAKKGDQWTFEELSGFLENPKKYAKGNKMAFAGIRKPQQRADLLLYLNSLSDSPLALPKPQPVEKVEEVVEEVAEKIEE